MKCGTVLDLHEWTDSLENAVGCRYREQLEPWAQMIVCRYFIAMRDAAELNDAAECARLGKLVQQQILEILR